MAERPELSSGFFVVLEQGVACIWVEGRNGALEVVVAGKRLLDALESVSGHAD